MSGRITNHESRITAAALAAALILTAGCKAFVSSGDPLVRDQEIIRDVKWRLHADARFEEVNVACEGRVVLLSGRVTSPQAAKDAEAIAYVRDVGRVVNRIEVRPK